MQSDMGCRLIVQARSWRASDGDGDLSLRVAIFQVAYGFGYVGERIRLAHHGSEATGLNLLTQFFEVSLPVRGDIHGQRWRTTGESMSARICRRLRSTWRLHCQR